MRHVQLIIGSVREGRIGDQIAGWIMNVAAEISGLSFELIDLKDWYIPGDDEPDQPKQGHGYRQPHTRAWSAKIASADGYVFLTPQYNWGYPASLKNALDHLYDEWANKPAVIISYGHRGGVKAAEQLRQVLHGLHMRPADPAPALKLTEKNMTANGKLISPALAFSDQEADIIAALMTLTSTPVSA